MLTLLLFAVITQYTQEQSNPGENRTAVKPYCNSHACLTVVFFFFSAYSVRSRAEQAPRRDRPATHMLTLLLFAVLTQYAQEQSKPQAKPILDPEDVSLALRMLFSKVSLQDPFLRHVLKKISRQHLKVLYSTPLL